MSDDDLKKFKFLVENGPDGVVILVRGNIVFINPMAIRLLGADPATVIGSSILQYLPPEDARLTMERIGAMFKTGVDMPPSDYRVIADPRRVVEIKSMICDWHGEKAVIAYSRDVTQRKGMEEKLIAADRFTALGKLAAGVAHEINNPLTYAQVSIELIERRLRELKIKELDEYIVDARHGLDRIAAVTSDLRTFSRPDTSASAPVDLGSAIEQSLRMVDNELRHRARLVRRYAGGIPAVMGSSSRIEQVFVNLLINAIHALRSPATDQIIVEIGHDGADRVLARVIDTGHGIPPDVIERVFDPFFTTKPVGVGMGLGLSVCKNLIEADGGTIKIDSSTSGTTVTLSFKIADEQTKPLEPPEPLVEDQSYPRRRVLIVDDEPFIRETLQVLLATYHDVTIADGGAAALAELGGAPVDVVLCDVMMPGMNGMELYRRIAADHAGLERRFVFVTGGAFAPELLDFLDHAGNRCLAKPFRLEQVLAAIRDVTT